VGGVQALMEMQQAAASQTIATLSHSLSVEVKAREKMDSECQQWQRRCETHRKFEQQAVEECVHCRQAYLPHAFLAGGVEAARLGLVVKCGARCGGAV
jgi:hypothetical protein